MRVVMTLVVRDEDDIVEQMLTYHLNAGVDHVIATDHRSDDRTTEILRRFEREGALTYIREDRLSISQGEVTTAMARRAAAEFGADWVIPADADEFWWSREGSLHDALGSIPIWYGVIRAPWRHFLLRPDDRREFHERMTLRRRPVLDLESVYQRQVKVLFRAHPAVRVENGNHGLLRSPGLGLRGWYPVEVLHFPARSTAQVARKFNTAGRAFRGRHLSAGASYHGGPDAFAASLRPVGPELERAVAEGAIVQDTRLRDAIRALRLGLSLPTWTPSLLDDLDFALDLDLVLEADTASRLPARLDAIEHRLSAVS